jgi:hypothetical protein
MEVSGAGSGIRQMQIVFRAGPDSGILRSGRWSDFSTSCGKIEEIEAELSTSKPPRRLREKLQ